MRKITIEGLWSVARGSALSLGWLVRRPSLARDFRRTLRTFGKGTLDLREAWLPYGLTDALRHRIGQETRVFEYGGGGSTAWFADLGAEVTTVEHHSEWLAHLSQQFREDERVELLERSDVNGYAEYVAAIDDYPDDSFDVVVVDGRERVRCFEHSVAKVKPGGLLILDDVDRTRYARAFEVVDWPREVVHGFAPCKPTMGHTAIFTRPVA
jgi:hypothetical protein